MSIPGLLVTLFGLYIFWRATHDDTLPAALIRFGLLALTAGMIGFVISNGLDHIIVHVLTHEDTRIATTLQAMADTIGSVRTGVVVSSGNANAFGAMLLAVGLRMTFESTFQRVTAHVMEVVAFIALASNLLGSHLHTAPLDALLGIFTLLVAVWFVILGVGIVREQDRMTVSS